MCRIPAPVPSIDEDLRGHLKVISPMNISFFSKSNSFVQDHLINHRFDQQTFQLNLSNIADDEGNLWISYLPEKTQRFFIPTELSSLGIFPQFNKQAFIRDVVEILNKHLYMVKIKFLINSFEFLLSLF